MMNSFKALFFLLLASHALAQDIYLSPQGSGKRDGSTAADAASAGDGQLQTHWDKLPAGGTLWLTSGTYPQAALIIHQSGEETKPKTLRGKDTGAGLPLLQSDFDKARPAKSGGIFLSAIKNASHWAVADLNLTGYMVAVSVPEGAAHFSLRNLSVRDGREGFRLRQVHDVEISGCRFLNYTKRGIRLMDVGPHVKITACAADAGGKEWATEPFHMGFAVESADPVATLENCVVFTDCTARNNYHDNSAKYWNADGFCVENLVPAVRFVSCQAFDNTDGGWDVKSKETVFQGCIALRNKRNFRVWAGATFANCVAAYAVHPGGSGGAAGLWTKGDVTILNSTFHGNPTAISVEDEGKVTITNSILSCPVAEEKVLWHEESKGRVTSVGNTICTEGDPASSPRFNAALPDWNGKPGDAFDSQRFQEKKGYSSQRIKVP